MSNKSYLLTPQARKSLRAAKLWSKNRWGDAQTKHYFETLHKTASYIGINHKSLCNTDALNGTAELGIYPSGEHYLVFLPIADKQVAIVDIIRQGRDIPTILAKNAPLIRRELNAIREKREQ